MFPSPAVDVDVVLELLLGVVCLVALQAHKVLEGLVALILLRHHIHIIDAERVRISVHGAMPLTAEALLGEGAEVEARICAILADIKATLVWCSPQIATYRGHIILHNIWVLWMHKGHCAV